MADRSFKENFWNHELGNFNGYELLLKKVKDGQKSTKDYLEYLKLRTSALETYGKSLQKLGKIAAVKTETGVMGVCWMNSLRMTESLSTALTKAALAMDGEVSHAIELTKKQREQRKREEDEMKQIQNALRAAMNKAQTRKRQYEAKFKEKKQAETALSQLVDGKDNTKALQRVQQVSQQYEAAACYLNQAEQQLEDARATWEQRTASCYEVFEALEEQRLNCVSNLQSTLLETDTGRLIAEETLVKLTVECTEEDVKDELETFVEKSKTDDEPPSKIKFSIHDSDDFDDFDSDDNGDHTYDTIDNVSATCEKTSGETKVDMASIQRKIFSLLPARKTKETKTLGKTNSTKKAPLPAVNDDEMVTNTMYATVTPGEGVTYDFGNAEVEHEADEEETMSVGSYKGSGTMMRVTFSYEAKHASDISLNEGQLVSLLQIVDDEWVEVKTSSEKRGYFPRGYLEPADS